MKNIIKLLLLFTIIAFTGCETKGGEGNRTDPLVTFSGSFIDRPVKGLSFETATMAGETSIDGNFSYVLNDDNTSQEVEFFLGNLSLGRALGQTMITPYTLMDENNVSSIDINNPSLLATNIARLLQSLETNASLSYMDIPLSLSTLVIEDINLSTASEADLLNIIYEAGIITGEGNVTLVDIPTAEAALKSGVEQGQIDLNVSTI